MAENKVISLGEVKSGKKKTIEWFYEGTKKDGSTYPLKIWENLECILQKHNIVLKYNQISHEIVSNFGKLTRNSSLTDIYSLQMRECLNMSRNEVDCSISRIAEKNQFNEFLEMLEQNKNDDMKIIKEVFSCLEINKDFTDNMDYYFTLFTKWCLNVVKMANNTLENDYSSQGVLVLQGNQGCYKSTFCRSLMPKKEWFKGDISLDTENKDSIIQNTKYVLVEWGELDSTLKGEQAKLKQFITATNDEYRGSYDRYAEKYPRSTSYIGTVNKIDFLKDETGSRRFWIIPVNRCNIEKLKSIDMNKFWGSVYNIWLNKSIEDYLLPDELQMLNQINSNYNYKNDVAITLDERIDWDSPDETWSVYNISEISSLLGIADKKSIKIELEKRDILYKVHKLRGGRCKKGFRMPRIDTSFNL